MSLFKQAYVENTQEDVEKISASDYMKTRSSRSQRAMKGMSRQRYANKGFGGGTRRKKAF